LPYTNWRTASGINGEPDPAGAASRCSCDWLSEGLWWTSLPPPSINIASGLFACKVLAYTVR